MIFKSIIVTLTSFLLLSLSLSAKTIGTERLLPISIKEIRPEFLVESEDSSFYKISKVKIKELSVDEDNYYMLKDLESAAKGIDEVIAIIDKIVAVGEKLWKIVEKGRPVVKTETQKVSVLPKFNGQIVSAMELEHWDMPKVKKFNVVFENKYGMKVVDFTYVVHYTPGGSFRGKGKYLSNVTIGVEKLNVMWGFDMSAISVVNDIANHGTVDCPVAGVTMEMTFKVNTVFQHVESSLNYHVTGEGKLLEL